MARNSFMMMLGQYFKKRREMVEIIVVSSFGAGIMVMGTVTNYCVRKYG